jgi:uncharacterized RDD family membrane protein YckC
MDQIASYVLTVPIEKNIIFTIFFFLINLPLYCIFQVRRLGGGVYVVQASWSIEDHGSVRRVSLGGR